MARLMSLIIPVLLVAACDAGSIGAAVSTAGAEPDEAAPVKVALVAPAAGQVMEAAHGSGGGGDCTPIRFERGASSATVTGSIAGREQRSDEGETECYSLDVAANQQAKVQLLPGSSERMLPSPSPMSAM